MNNYFNDFTNDDSNEEVFVENENFYGPGVNKTYVDHVVEYLAGFLTRVILKKLRCDYCPLLLINETSQSALLNKKNRGGLIKPCNDIFEICKIIEKICRLHYASRKGISIKLFNLCLNSIPPDLLKINHYDDSHKHRLLLIKKLFLNYLRIRMKHYAKQKKQATIKGVRRIYTKLILFQNE